jgi:tRNA pseudouridine38-40 synthase
VNQQQRLYQENQVREDLLIVVEVASAIVSGDTSAHVADAPDTWQRMCTAIPRDDGSRSLPRGRESAADVTTSAVFLLYCGAVRHIRLLIEYDGSTLHGWQRQLNGATVQQHLEESLGKMLGHAVTVTGASRTDAGVHARGQVASFRTERAIPLHGFRRGLNSMLPATIAVRAADEVDDTFHPRFSATGKHYRYTMLLARDRSPRWRDRAWHHPGRIDLDAMRAAAAHLVGVHDFAAFRAAGCSAKTTIRRIDSLEVIEGDETLVIDVRGNAFLRNMVRILVGTIAEVAEGRWPASQVVEIIASKDRTLAGETAPARGLELIEVYYDGTRVSPEHDSR